MAHLERFRFLVVGAALLAAAAAASACAPMLARPTGLPPGGPNDPVPAEYIRGTQFDKPNMIRYSWGLLEVPPPNDGPQVKYSWSEIRSHLAARNR